MTTWTSPATWASGASLTAAQLNAEIRDHANYLKGALDLITNSTTADTGSGTYLRVKRTAIGDAAYEAGLSTDTVMRWTVNAAGEMRWGPGGTTATEFTLYRSGSNTLRLIDAQMEASRGLGNDLSFRAYVNGDAAARFQVSASGEIAWGSGAAAPDTTLYRSGVNNLRSGGNFSGESFIGLGTLGSNWAYTSYLSGDANPSWGIEVDGTLKWGVGGASAVDYSLSRDGAAGSGHLVASGPIGAAAGLKTRTKAGAPVDGDFVTGFVGDGILVMDTTNNRLYVRTLGVWKSVVLA